MSFSLRFLFLLSLPLLVSSCGSVKPDGVLGEVMDGKIFDGSAKVYCGKKEEDAQRDLKRCMASSVNEEPHGMTFKLNN
jgi:hypothetical protein